MKSTDPLFPYQNLFITARPGMGVSTIVANIVNKYLDEGKKCLVFDAKARPFLNYADRAKVIRENTNIESIRSFPLFEEYGDLTVAYNRFIFSDVLLSVVEEKAADIVIYEENSDMLFKNQTKELVELAKILRRKGKIFIFVTHLKRNRNPFTHTDKNIPSASRFRKAMPFFDATAIVYRNGYYDEVEEVIEEIRLYERGKKKYRAVPVEFDFQHQRIKRK